MKNLFSKLKTGAYFYNVLVVKGYSPPDKGQAAPNQPTDIQHILINSDADPAF